MKALTIWQPWASLIAADAKPYEFRKWDYRTRVPGLEGERIVIHAGVRPVRKAEIADILDRLDSGETALNILQTREVLARSNNGRTLLLGHGLGTARLGTPKRATDLYGDSDRIDHEMWAWPLTDWQPFEPPIPMRGFQGFWTWPT